MDKLTITGQKTLHGSVEVSGAKNSALALLAASVMAEGEVVLDNIPVIADVLIQVSLLQEIGAKVHWIEANKIIISTNNSLANVELSYEQAKKLRASNLFLGALLAKTGKAVIPLPGGCNIGSRPMDLHLKGLKQLGVKVQLSQGHIIASGENMVGTKIYLDFPSVGATENIMMAATNATGTTVIENAAKEPEIVDLASFLTSMGAKIRGAGTDVIRITGKTKLTSSEYTCIPDRIEAGTYMIAAAITRSKIKVGNVIPTHLKSLTAKLHEMGIKVVEGENWIQVDALDGEFRPVDIRTMPYPGFPTDLQSPMISFLATVRGTSTITENVFEGRYGMVDELKRMGAKIKIEGRTAIIQGGTPLSGTDVKGQDLRGAAGLVLAALAAEGDSVICGIECVQRGYENMVHKLNLLGAHIIK